MMSERHAAEDLLQEVFLSVWLAAESYRAERGNVRTWILSMVRNRGVDQIRYRESRRKTRQKLEASAPRYQPSEAFAQTWRSLRREQIRAAVNTLPPEQLEVLELAYYRAHTHVEIADLMDIPLGTVKGRMRLGLKKLRNYFESPEEAALVPSYDSAAGGGSRPSQPRKAGVLSSWQPGYAT